MEKMGYTYVQGQTRARVGEQGIERESGFRVQSAEVFRAKGSKELLQREF